MAIVTGPVKVLFDIVTKQTAHSSGGGEEFLLTIGCCLVIVPECYQLRISSVAA